MLISRRMTKADHYRTRAAEFAALSYKEKNPARQLEYAKMAKSYLRLAEQADRNSETNVVYETPARSEFPSP